jgi:hypothetical protein
MRTYTNTLTIAHSLDVVGIGSTRGRQDAGGPRAEWITPSQ